MINELRKVQTDAVLCIFWDAFQEVLEEAV
jgi:hypothetical protein